MFRIFDRSNYSVSKNFNGLMERWRRETTEGILSIISIDFCLPSISNPNLSPETGEMNGKEGIFRKQPACIVTFSLVVRNKKKKRKKDPTIAEYRSNWRKVGRGMVPGGAAVTEIR